MPKMGGTKRVTDAGDNGGGGIEQSAALGTADAGEQSDIPIVDPADAIGEAGGEQPKKRGRKPGSKNRPKQPEDEKNLKGVEKTLLAIHTMGAAYFKIPELVLTPKEAEAIAGAIEDVGEYYAIDLDPRYVVWGNLLMVLCGTYGTRFGAYKARVAAERASETQGPAMPIQPVNGALVDITGFMRT